jgi:hypothetical protein
VGFKKRTGYLSNRIFKISGVNVGIVTLISVQALQSLLEQLGAREKYYLGAVNTQQD